jgi:hypothetical protein
MQNVLQIVKNKLQNELFDYLDVKSSKDQDFTQNLKIKDLCLLYLAPSYYFKLSWKLSNQQHAYHERCAHHDG